MRFIASNRKVSMAQSIIHEILLSQEVSQISRDKLPVYLCQEVKMQEGPSIVLLMRVHSSDPKKEVTTTILATRVQQRMACLRNPSSLRRKLSTRIRLGRRRRSRRKMRTPSIRTPTAIEEEVIIRQRSSRSSPPRNTRVPSRSQPRSQTSASNPCRGNIITTCSRWMTIAVGRKGKAGRVGRVTRVEGASKEIPFKSQTRRVKRRGNMLPRRILIMCTSRKTKASFPGWRVSNAQSKSKKKKNNPILFNLMFKMSSRCLLLRPRT